MTSCKYWCFLFACFKGMNLLYFELIISVLNVQHTVSSSVVVTSQTCPPVGGWSQDPATGKYYLEVEDKKTFWDAYLDCRSYGAQLAMAKTQEDFDFLEPMLDANFGTTWGN